MNSLPEKILEEIRKQGAISFKRFMECALYCPVYGYYEKEGDTIGRRGDYFTSVSVGPLFGQLLAFQFAEWLDELANRTKSDSGPLYLAEAGADRGQLASDILSWLLAYRPGLFDKLEYWLIEPSERRRSRQRSALERFVGKVNWADTPAELGQKPGGGPAPHRVRGILFCNELLDAMPVHRLGWDAVSRNWFEWGVGQDQGRLVWVRLKDNGLRAQDGLAPEVMRNLFSSELAKVLPEGFVVEVPTLAGAWWRQAAGILSVGKLVALDYGFTEDEWMVPERAGGTLRAYRGHHVTNEVLDFPGEQDITAHVNFSFIAEAGKQAGLSTEALSTQERFLTRIAARLMEKPADGIPWNSEQVRQFQMLTHPNQLGHSFRVLIQSRNGVGPGTVKVPGELKEVIKPPAART